MPRRVLSGAARARLRGACSAGAHCTPCGGQALILAKKDDKAPESGKFLVDLILDKTGMKGTGKWTVQQGAELSIAAPTMATSLDARFISGLKDNRVKCEAIYAAAGLPPAGSSGPAPGVDKAQLIADVKAALYCAKVCSYRVSVAPKSTISTIAR